MSRIVRSILVVALLLSASTARGEFYFGDLHAHSGLSDDASGDPEGFFLTARDVAGLDFVALTDHDAFLTPNEWEIAKTLSASFDRPGEFVAFSAVEWTHHWHMNAIFERHDEELCFDCGFPPDFFEFYGPRVEAKAAAAHINHPADLWTIDWLQIDDTITTGVEVWNTGGAGNNEPGFGNALWALRAGFRLGLLGVSDDHHTDQQPLLLGTGLTGCEVDALERADLLAALRERRCYATSGERIELRLSVDGEPMGSELARPVGDLLPVVVDVRGTASPVTIELVQGGDVIARERCNTKSCALSARVGVLDPTSFLFARVIQPDDERAWSSPVWISGECAGGASCYRSRLTAGGGDAEDDCLVEWLRPGFAFREALPDDADVSCIDGDPRCDFGDATGECTVRLALCAGVESGASRGCSPAAPETFDVLAPDPEAVDRNSLDYQNQHTLLSMFHALRLSNDGFGCSPASQLRVPVGQTVIVTRAELGSRVDEDQLVLECRPGRAPGLPRLVGALPSR